MADKGEEKLKFQEEIAQIFKSVFMRDVTITTKGYQKIREAMSNHLQDIFRDAMMRAIRRESSLSTLQLPDLLYAVEKKGQKYKLKVGKTFVSSAGFGDFGERKYVLNYQEEGDDLQNDNQK